MLRGFVRAAGLDREQSALQGNRVARAFTPVLAARMQAPEELATDMRGCHRAREQKCRESPTQIGTMHPSNTWELLVLVRSAILPDRLLTFEATILGFRNGRDVLPRI